MFVALDCLASTVFTALTRLTLFVYNTHPLTDPDIILVFSQLGLYNKMLQTGWLKQ